MDRTNEKRGLVKNAGLIVALIVFVLFAFVESFAEVTGLEPRASKAAGVTLMMAILWLTEALPIAVTACVPLVTYPFLSIFPGGVTNGARSTILPYLDGYIFLFAGGMCIAAAMQQWNLHRRIALTIMKWIGTEPRRLLLGFLASTSFISMWISNTATATMMLPIGMAVIAQFEMREGGRRLDAFASAIMLSIAYGANIGGIGTKIGTAPNATFAGFMGKHGVEISFLDFLVVGAPFVLLMIPVAWFFLWRLGRHDAPRTSGTATVREELAKLGRVQRGEWMVLGVFFVTAGLWIAAKPIQSWLAPLVAHMFKLTSAYLEGGIAVMAALVLFVLRSSGRAVLEFRSLRRVPWDTLVLLGGSFSMAEGVQQSGLSEWMSTKMSQLQDLPLIAQILAVTVATVAISAVASNTATINVMLNVLWNAVAPAHRATVLFASTIAASCDFALPAGTPPNAIVFGSGYISIPRMAKVGVLLDLSAAILAALWCLLAVRWVC